MLFLDKTTGYTNESEALSHSISFPHVCDPDANLLTVFVAKGPGGTCSVSYGGQSLTQIGEQGNIFNNILCFQIVNPPTGSNDVQIDVTNTSVSYLRATAISHIGASTTTPYRSVRGNSGTSGYGNVDISTKNEEQIWYMVAVSYGELRKNNSSVFTPNIGEVKVYDNNLHSWMAASTVYRNGSGSVLNFINVGSTWTTFYGGEPWIILAINLRYDKNSPSSSESRSASRSSSPSPSRSRSLSPSLSFSLSPSRSPSSSISPSSSPSPSLLNTTSVSPSSSASSSISPSLSPSSSPSASSSYSPSFSTSLSYSLSPSLSPSLSFSSSLSPSKSPSASPSNTPSLSISLSPSASPSTSTSRSPSLSISSSISPSASPSTSISASPSPAEYQDIYEDRGNSYSETYQNRGNTHVDTYVSRGNSFIDKYKEW